MNPRQHSLLYFAARRPPYEQAGKIPSVIFYGTDRLREDPEFSFSVKWKRNLFLRFACRPLEKYLIGRVGVGFRLDQALWHLPSLRVQRVILAETDSTGLPLLLLKRLGLVKGHIGFISAGLINTLEHQQTSRLFVWYRWLLQAADFIVCWSPVEEQMYHQIVGAKAHFVQLEADIDFYKSDPSGSLESYVLCVGRDVGRDFQTLFTALGHLNIPAKVVTSSARVRGLRVPDNVELILDFVEYPAFLALYRRARMVVVSLQEIHRFTGQRALLESLAMGKATVVAKTQAVVGSYALKDEREVIFYEPGNVHDLAQKVRTLYENEEQIRSLAMHARLVVEQLPSNSFYKGVRKILLDVCAES